MPDKIGRGLHGGTIDLSGYLPPGMALGGEALVEALLDSGNWLRYGMTEEERQDLIARQAVPGFKDAAYDERGIYDPAAAERYTSAYLFGRRFTPPEEVQPVLHSISSGGREAMNKIPVLRDLFGVGEERDALRRAEELGMSRGSSRTAGSSLARALMGRYQ